MHISFEGQNFVLSKKSFSAVENACGNHFIATLQFVSQQKVSGLYKGNF
jgi:hypothetical protein